jgi:hypothetical protein
MNKFFTKSSGVQKIKNYSKLYNDPEFKNKFINEDFIKFSINFKNKFTFLEKEIKKVIIRPLMIKHEKCLQFSYYSKTQDISKNVKLSNTAGIDEKLDIILKEGDDNYQFVSKHESIMCKDGKDSIKKQNNIVNLEHDKKKKIVIPIDENQAFYKKIGFFYSFNNKGLLTSENKIRSSKSDKITQINQFLKIIKQLEINYNEELNIVDCGCGIIFNLFFRYWIINFITKFLFIKNRKFEI